jgi:hypothetical protein
VSPEVSGRTPPQSRGVGRAPPRSRRKVGRAQKNQQNEPPTSPPLQTYPTLAADAAPRDKDQALRYCAGAYLRRGANQSSCTTKVCGDDGLVPTRSLRLPLHPGAKGADRADVGPGLHHCHSWFGAPEQSAGAIGRL